MCEFLLPGSSPTKWKHHVKPESQLQVASWPASLHSSLLLVAEEAETELLILAIIFLEDNES